MPPPLRLATGWAKTGEVRARVGLFRRVVLEVEERRRHYTGPFHPDSPKFCGRPPVVEVRWRRARAEDISSALILRPLGASSGAS